LPNVLIEAQSQRLACVATDVSGIPELIEHGVTGLLAAPNDPVTLARKISELIRDPARRAGLAAAGERRARSLFAMDAGIDALARRFGLNQSSPPPRVPPDFSPPLYHVAPLDADTAMLEAPYRLLDVVAPLWSDPKPP
jgi:glycosyl transferase family 1